MLGGRDHLILSGVWSSRMYLKQENEACQNLLCRYLEPLAAMARFRYGESWPDGLLAVAWRDLLRNHPHDSICGCSTDDVHHDMQTRFAAVRQTGEQYLSRLLDRLTPTFARREADDRLTVLNVTNPLPQRRDEVVERLVVMQPLDYDLESLRLIDEDGREVPCEILRTRFLERFWGVDYRAELFCEDQLDIQTTYLRRFGHRIVGTEYDRGTMDAFLHVRFLARDLPGLGHRQYYLVDGRDIRNALPFYAPDPGEPSVAFTPVQARLDDPGTARLSNEHLRVTLYGDGTCDVEDRATGHFYAGLNMLEDTEDAGDEYDYSPAPGGMTYFAAGTPGKVRLVRCTELAATASTTFSFDLPRSLESDRHSRQTRTTPCDVTVSVTLHSGQRRLDFVTEVNNRAFDHRLRAWFPSGLRTSTVVSDGQFLLNSRPLQRPTGKGWSQPAPPTWPQQDFSLLSDAQGGLAVFNRGLPEFETFPDSNGDAVLALTLLRCVDWLSRDDFPSRNQTNAGPTLYTPDAQCIGRHVFRYAVAPFSGDPVAADIKGQSERYRTPPLTHQGVADQLRPGGSAFLEKTAPEVAVTAVKLAEHDDRLVVRLCNLAAEPAVETLRCGLPVLAVEKAGLLEQPLPVERDPATLSTDGHGVEIPLAAHEIATVMVRLDHGPQDEETP